MKKIVPTLLMSQIWVILYSSTGHAALAEQCLVGIPLYERPLVEDDINTQPVRINSQSSSANYPDSAVFEGDVSILQGNRRLQADRAEIEQSKKDTDSTEQRVITVTGNVHYDDHQIQLNGSKAVSNMNNKDSDIFDASYQMVGRQGRGTANKIELRDNRYEVMQNGTFTTCLPSNNSWSVVGSEITHDRQEEVAEIWNARFKVGPVPVFYTPYLQLPTGNKRRSGFLIPEFSYGNSSGLNLALPYYINIAPNFDATLTPRYIEERGFQIQNEFRYLLNVGTGLLEFDWLDHDRKYRNQYPDDNRNSRWLFHWQHGGVLDQVWRFNVDYTKVSDNNYLNDIDTRYGNTTDGYVDQKYSIGYANQYWDTALKFKRFQIFSSDVGNKNAYRAEPQLDINNYLYDLGLFNLQTYAQIARFVSENQNNPKATRLHIEPTLSLPINNGWGALNSELKLLATHYKQDIPNSYNKELPLTSSVSRLIPQYKVYGKLIFDRDTQWLDHYTQTLEPKVQYLYRPFKAQDKIYTYDTTLLQSDYMGLFRDRDYSGLDRIPSANQLSAGLTTRLYDENLNERFNGSIGQIYHFSEPKTSKNENTLDKSGRSGSVVWAADSYWKVSDNLVTRANVQYDDRVNRVALGEWIMEYRQDDEKMIQVGYRYASQEYISAMVNKNSGPYQQDLNQVGVVASWPLAINWAAVGAYYYDPRQNQLVDGLLGLQYSNCCWAFGVNVERKIVNWSQTTQKSEYDNKVSFNLELRGLSSNHNLGTAKMLSSNILPYQPAF